MFGDGPDTAPLSTDATGPAITAWGEHTWPRSRDVMGWNVMDDGLGVVFSRDIPSLVHAEMRPATERFPGAQGLCLADIDRFPVHPGGAKVLEALEASLALEPDALDHACATLAASGWLVADAISLADLHLAPMATCMLAASEGTELWPTHTKLDVWWQAILERPSMTATRDDGMAG